MRGCHFLGARVTQKVVSSSIWVAGPQQVMLLTVEPSLQTLSLPPCLSRPGSFTLPSLCLSFISGIMSPITQSFLLTRSQHHC